MSTDHSRPGSVKIKLFTQETVEPAKMPKFKLWQKIQLGSLQPIREFLRLMHEKGIRCGVWPDYVWPDKIFQLNQRARSSKAVTTHANLAVVGTKDLGFLGDEPKPTHVNVYNLLESRKWTLSYEAIFQLPLQYDPKDGESFILCSPPIFGTEANFGMDTNCDFFHFGREGSTVYFSLSLAERHPDPESVVYLNPEAKLVIALPD